MTNRTVLPDRWLPMFKPAITSIKNQIIAIILLVCFLTIGAAFTIVTVTDVKRIKKNLADEAAMAATLVGQSCVSALIFDYPLRAAENLDMIRSFPGMVNAWIYTTDDTLFAVCEKGNDGPALKGAEQKTYAYSKGFLHVAQPIVYQGKTYGTIYVKISPKIKKQITSRIIFILGLAAGLFLIAYLLAGYAQRIVSDPILRLAGTVEAFSRSSESAVRLKNTYKGEVGALYDAFNAMLKAVRSREREKDAAEKEYRKIFENAVEGIFRISPDGRIQNANPSFARILGYRSVEEMFWAENRTFFPLSDEERKEFIGLLDKKGKVVARDLQLVKKWGDTVWCTVSASKIQNDDNPGVYYEGVAIDITERRERDEAQKEWKAAREANRAKSEFLANMSHEIRTPLNALLGFSELLRINMTDPKQKRYADAMKSSGKSLLTLINDILDLSKIEAGKLVFTYEPVCLKRLLWEIENIFKKKITDKGIEFRMELDDTLPDYLVLDEIRIRQVLMNLVGNAAKFTESGQIILSAEKQPAPGKGFTGLLIKVADTGPGIHEKDRTMIFDAFKQVNGQINRLHGGTGLGLAICKRLVSAMNGEINVISKPGLGSTFSVRLESVEIATTEVLSVMKADSPAPIDPTCFKRHRILIADDIESNRLMLKELLIRFNQEVIEAKDGEEVLELVNTTPPDLIILDVRMPGMSGNEAVVILKSDPAARHIPVIAFTADIVAKNRTGALKKGYDGYLTKPIDVQELACELAKYIGMENQGLNHHEPDLAWPRFAREDVIKPDLLVSRLKNEVLVLWQTHYNVIIISRIQAFSEKLRQLAEEHHVPPLMAYSQDLSEHVELFDIAGIKKRMDAFPGFIETLTREMAH